MTDEELDAEDADVPEQAVKALNDAYERAVREGRTLVFVRDNQLIRQTPDGTTVIRAMPPRKRVLRTRFTVKKTSQL